MTDRNADRHHPSDQTLASFDAGSLGAGPALVVATHLADCAECRHRAAQLGAFAGGLLEQFEPTPMQSGAWAATWARAQQKSPADGGLQRKVARGSGGHLLDRAASGDSAVSPASPRRSREQTAPILPAVLQHCSASPWRWLGNGVRWSSVTVPDAPDASLLLLRIAAGARLPAHTHRGCEFTQVLEGAFSDARGLYRPGDFDEADDDVDHQPAVVSDQPCVCLTSIDGRMHFHGWLARAVSSLVRL